MADSKRKQCIVDADCYSCDHYRRESLKTYARKSGTTYGLFVATEVRDRKLALSITPFQTIRRTRRDPSLKASNASEANRTDLREINIEGGRNRALIRLRFHS